MSEKVYGGVHRVQYPHDGEVGEVSAQEPEEYLLGGYLVFYYQDFHSGCKVKKDDGYFQFVKKMLQFVAIFPQSVGNYNV